MNRKEAEELLPIIKAFSEGRIIEFSSITDVSKTWREVTDFPIGMIKNFKFRIKPEYRPFANAEECWNEMLKHQPFGWVKDKVSDEYFNVYCISNDNEGKELLERMFKRCVFIDKNPFGVKDEEE